MHRPSHVSPARCPHPTPYLGDISCPLTCGQKELQHHRRQQLHGPEPGGDGEAAITLDAAAAGRLHRSQAAEGSEIPPGKEGLPASGCDPAEEPCGRGTSVCSESVRSSAQPLYARQADQSRTACSSRGRLSALRQRAAGIRLLEKQWKPRPTRPRPPPLPLSRRAGPGRRRCPGLGSRGGRTRRRSHFWDQARAAVAGVWV